MAGDRWKNQPTHLKWLRQAIAPLIGRSADDLEAEPCIVAPFKPATTGYARVTLDGREMGAHQAACLLLFGPAPADKPITRHGPCNNRLCVLHVRWGTHYENIVLDRRRDGSRVRRGPAKERCSVDGCDRPGRTGLCSMHARRAARNGDPTVRQRAPRKV